MLCTVIAKEDGTLTGIPSNEHVVYTRSSIV